MSKSKTKVPKITDDLKKAVELYLLAKTIHEQVTDTISNCKRAILAKRQFSISEDQKEKQSERTRGHGAESPIIDPFFDFMMSEADFEVYMQDLYTAEKAAGLEPEFVGHSVDHQYQVDVWECEKLIAEASEYITGIDWETMKWQYQNRIEFIDLTVKFVLSACPEITGEATLQKYLN